jgi:hypothetical protein
MTNETATSPMMIMLHMIAGCWISQAIYVAAKLGIADLLQTGTKSCDVLAAATRTHPDALYRLLRTLSSLGVFSETQTRVFQLTPLAECLRTEAPDSLRAFAILLGEEEHWRAWGHTLHCVSTGQSAFEHVFGMSHFEYFAQHPETARLFNEGMTSRSGQENAAIISAYDFSNVPSVIDVGGGHGSLLASILRATANTKCVLFDLPHVVATARAAGWGTVQESRCEFREGDFFDAVPPGGDAYVLKKVIHDWDDERALSILKNCRKALPSAARLLLIEPVIPPGNGRSFNKLLDLLMLIWTSGGKERTEGEHRDLLSSAGFRCTRVISTSSPLTIIEAVAGNDATDR